MSCPGKMAIAAAKGFFSHSLVKSKGSSSSSSSADEKKHVVVVVGGGYGGIRAAVDLDRSGHFHVVLLDRKDYFLNNIAGVPAAVQPGYADGMCVPYDKLFTQGGQVIQAVVTEVGPDGVLVHGHNEPLRFDHCIVATGTSYAFPFKVPDISSTTAKEKFATLPALVKDANVVVVAGGGAVGCEMAGEVATAHPGKRVVLVHSRDKLLPGEVNDELRARTLEHLRNTKKVEVILGERLVEGLEEVTGEPGTSNQTFLAGKRKLRTDKGTEIEADLVFLCWGAAVNNACLKSRFGDQLDPQGRIKVDAGTLRVAGLSNVFAIGDVSGLEAKMACYAGEQGAYVARALIAEVKGQAAAPPYSGHPNPAMMVPLGGHAGYIQLPNPKGTVLGSPFAALGKAHLIKLWANRARPAHRFQCPFSSGKSEEADAKALAAGMGLSAPEALLAIEQGAFPVQDATPDQAHT